MKRNLSFLWILLAAAVVFACWQLPGFVLTRMGTPNFAMDYQTVEISSQASTDYFWRLKTAVRQQMYYTANLDDPALQETVITDRYSEEERGILTDQVLKEVQTLADGGVFPSTVLDMMRQAVSNVEVMYLFDAGTLRGFPYARFSFVLDRESTGKTAGTYQVVHMYTDLSSGKIFILRCYGFSTEEIEKGYTGVSRFWYDPLRSFADYLGLGADTTANTQGESALEGYDYESIYTVDLLGVESPDGNGWFELRAVQDAGGQSFALLLYRCSYEM